MRTYVFRAGVVMLVVFAFTASGSIASAASSFAESAATSVNWAGYVASGGTYTGIGGTWKVPEPQSDSDSLSADATWVGIGGSASEDLIQAGTQAAVEDGRVEYEAWYEGLPGGQRIIPFTIQGGDTVSVSIKETAPQIWQISFVDDTTGRQFQTLARYDSSLSSAEWIEEAPSAETGRGVAQLPLDDFGSASFIGGYTIVNGSYKTIAASGAEPLSMTDGRDVTLAAPSSLGEDGASFSVARSDVSDTASYAEAEYPHQRHARRPSIIIIEQFSWRR